MAAAVTAPELVAVLLAVAAVLCWPAAHQGSVGAALPGAPGSTLDGAAPLLPRRKLGGLGGGHGGRGRHEWVAEFAELAGVALRAGLPAGDAGRLAAGLVTDADPRLSAWVEAACRRGEPLGAPLGELHRSGVGGRELGFLAAAWQLGDELGAATAPAAGRTALVVRRQVEAEQRRAAAVAGPRTSMWVLTALPLLGPVAVLAMGAPAGTFGRPVPLAALGLGVLLTGLGWALATRMLARAQRPLALERAEPG